MDAQIIETAKDLFSLLDKQQKGFISIDELCTASELGNNFTDSQLHFVFSTIDKDGEGKITLDDFTEAFLTLSKEDNSVNRHENTEGLSLLSSQLERSESVHKDNSLFKVFGSSFDSDGMQAGAETNNAKSDLKKLGYSSDSFVGESKSTIDRELVGCDRSRALGTTDNDGHKDDVFEGEGLLNIEARSYSQSPSRLSFPRSPSMRRIRSNENRERLARSNDELIESEVCDRSPPDGNECEISTSNSSPKIHERKSLSREPSKAAKSKQAFPGSGFAKEAIFDLLKIVDAHTLSNLGLYNKNGRPLASDVTSNSSNFFGGASLGNERSCPRWLHTSQDWTENARADSKLDKKSVINDPDCVSINSEACTGFGTKVERPIIGSMQDLRLNSEGDPRLFSPTSDYSQSSDSQSSDFNPANDMEDNDFNRDQRMCIGARVENETVGNLIFESTDEGHDGLYDRILSCSGVELNSLHSASETSLHDLILEAEVARKSASLVEGWDSVMKRINGVTLFGGNQTIRYLWQQLSVYNSDLVQPFEDFLKGVVAEFQRAYMKCQELDTLLNSKGEQHERELARVYEEMDQLLLREKEQLQDKHGEREEHLRAEFNRILEAKENDLTDALKIKAEAEAKIERSLEEFHQLKAWKERLEKQLNAATTSEAQLRNENDCLSQENRLLNEKLSQVVQNFSDMQEQLMKLSKVADANREDYKRCFRKYQDALEEREYFDMNINNLTQELQDLRNANKTLQERVDINLNTSILWREGQVSPRSPNSPDLQRKRGSRVFGFPNGIMPISNSQRNSLVSEPSFDESIPDVTVSHNPPLPVPDLIPSIPKIPTSPPKTTSTPVKTPIMTPRMTPVISTGQEYKVIFVGDAAVGKSSLIRKISRGTFSSRRAATANPDCHTKVVTVNNQSVTLNLWDTVGQERFNSLPPSYFRKADVVVLVYDVIEEISFLNVKSWIKTIYEYTDENVLLVLCGNKVDLDHKRKVKEQRAVNLAKLNDAIFVESSAKTGYNVPKLCETIASTLLERDDTVLIREKSVKIYEQDLLNMSKSSMKTCC
ncbi:uncharacterized protein LOC135680741 isoform X2 [Rhopilema esculentum]|uniref:uncharacterized protein LOC135680741 isoform X2 n=1 Tax=Rhopilema esculentum TaxID=499914 RepID=UPI0031D72961